MTDWNDMHLERDGLPRGYVVAARDQLEPVAPASWMRFDTDVGVQMAIELADEHLRVVGRRDPMDVRVLARGYETLTLQGLALSPLSCAFLTPNMLDAFAVPVALAARVRRSGTTERAEGRIVGANIRGCRQEDWFEDWKPFLQRPYLSTMDIDRGRAWPTAWGCFTNPGLGSAVLTVEVVNPSREHTIDVELFVFARTYASCPVAPEELGRRPLCPPLPKRTPFGGTT